MQVMNEFEIELISGGAGSSNQEPHPKAGTPPFNPSPPIIVPVSM
jgi:hypothetical protein